MAANGNGRGAQPAQAPAPPDQGKKGGSGVIIGQVLLTLYDRPQNNVEIRLTHHKRPMTVGELDGLLKWGLQNILAIPVPSQPGATPKARR